MNLPGYVNIRYEGHEKVLRDSGITFDVFLSNKLWKRYVADKDPSVEDARLWDVLFMLRTFTSGPAAIQNRPRIYQVCLPELESPEVTLVAHVHERVLAFCISLDTELLEHSEGGDE